MKSVLYAAILGLGACAVDPPGQDPGPFPANYETAIRSYLHEHLKDPYSVRDLDMSPPVMATVWTGLLNYGSLPAWKSCVVLNAKNSYGGYIGAQMYSAYLIDGEVAYWLDERC